MTDKFASIVSLPVEKPERRKKKHFRVGSFMAMILGVAFVIVPIYIVIITSLTSDIEANNAAFSWWPKMGLTLEGYTKAFTKKVAGNSLLRSFFNTMWMYIPSTAIGVFVSAMSAFAKLDFKLKKPMFAILMATLTLPNCIGFIASFLMFDKMG